MEATLLAIFVPIAYAVGWLIAGRIIFTMWDDDLGGEGVVSMLIALFWPVLALLFPAWMFVTWPKLKKERAAEKARIEQQKEWEGRQKTAELERSIYGRAFR